MKNVLSFFSWLCHYPIPRLAVILLVSMVWSNLAYCSEIHDAAKNGELDKIKTLLIDNPTLVFLKDGWKQDWTPLHWAAANGHKDVAEFLLENKADVNAKDVDDETPLDLAATNGYKDVVELLLANKADVNAKTKSSPGGFIGGWTPLHSAAFKDYKDIAELLIAKGADINAKDNKDETPLQLAVQKGNEDILELMLPKDQDALANLAAKDNDPNLCYAAAGRIQDVHILDNIVGSMPNPGNRMPTIVVLRKLMAETNILQKPVRISLRVTPRYLGYLTVPSNNPYAGENVQGEVVDISIIGSDKTVLAHETWKTKFPNSTKVLFIPAPVKLLDLIVDLCDTEHYSQSQIQLILAKIASQDGDRDIWKQAMNKLTNYSEDTFDNYSTPLFWSVLNDDKDMVKLLLTCGAGVNAAKSDEYNPCGDTPLHMAAFKGYKDMVILLLANKAKVNAKDCNGFTPLDMTDKKDIEKLLRQHGGHYHTN